MNRKLIIGALLVATAISSYAAPSTVFKVGTTHTYKTMVLPLEVEDGVVNYKYVEKTYFEGSVLTANGDVCVLTTTVLLANRKFKEGDVTFDLPETLVTENAFACPPSIKLP
ncbi:hypothetical protein [Comamonas thiooxydans]|uniref:hypothetical protein n=1 Tax=Comamonas thiooxydans TaxID=363952 RepID=UPI000B417984|nr:hypothetical protein [Comamonas thiooxydans]